MEEDKIKILDEIKQRYPDKDFGEEVHVRRVVNWDFDRKHPMPFDSGRWEVYFDHQCDEWVVGGQDKASQMAKDLLEAVKYIESFKE